MKYTFTELTVPDELRIIRDIASRIWPETFRKILSPRQIEYMMKMMYAPEVMIKELADGYHFEVIFIDDVPAGYISYSAYTIPETAKIHKVYLLSQYHHKGFGQIMLDRAQEQCRKLGFSKVRLNVNKYNSAAIKAYERNGFSNIESVKVPIGEGFFMDDFVMEKQLR